MIKINNIKKDKTPLKNTIKLFSKFISSIISQIWSFATFSFWAQILAAFKKKGLQFTCYITDILRKSLFEMSQEELININYFKSYSKLKKALNFCSFW